jgi:hypothetical protein
MHLHRALLVCPTRFLRPEDFKLSGVRVAAEKDNQSISTISLETALQ